MKNFDAWHEAETIALCERNRNLPIGWSVKLINVYLKTAVYVGDLGHSTLRNAIHPPIDSGLWHGVALRFRKQPEIVKEVCCVQRIKDITVFDL